MEDIEVILIRMDVGGIKFYLINKICAQRPMRLRYGIGHPPHRNAGEGDKQTEKIKNSAFSQNPIQFNNISDGEIFIANPNPDRV
jgi:hypothetical protein